jgi:omega-6 fatty acid desaturase (delta-12 desaturase)
VDKQLYLEIRKTLGKGGPSWALPKHLLLDLLLLSLIKEIWVLSGHSPLKFLVAPLVAALMFRGFSLMHEAVHGVACKNRFWNNVVGTLAGGLCFLPFAPWQKSHLDHHYWSGNIDRDPVMAIIRTFPLWPAGLQAAVGFCWRAWLPLVALMQHAVFWTLSLQQGLEKPNPKILFSLCFPLLLWGSVLSVVSADFALGAVLPATFLYFSLIEIVNFPHHLELPQYRGDAKLQLWEQHEIARSCLYPKWFARYVVLNFNFHAAHHMFPDLPWYRLEEAHMLLKEKLQNRYIEDPHFSWILKNRPKSMAELLAPSAMPAELETKKAA